MTDKTNIVGSSKAKANALMKSGKYLEAIMEYSEGIAMQPSNPVLYSNRSLAFLKVDQYFFALKDAETTIRLVPDWAKGYYRKGQAEQAAEMYALAIATYESGLRLCPCDEMLLKSLEEAKKLQQKIFAQRRATLRRYTIVAGVIGCLLVIGDMWQPQFSFFRYPWLRGIVLTCFPIIGYLLASLILSFQRSSKAILLNPPPELLSGSNIDYNSVGTNSSLSGGTCANMQQHQSSSLTKSE
ncbi:uncharacterized protein LOC143453271 [Clavelina lepadiformis]|uniref:uncharacterized protein LOC143453271 n=1 Tax=Clavelina lepadiformis TaxID=159417 RepID=UPI0040418C52